MAKSPPAGRRSRTTATSSLVTGDIASPENAEKRELNDALSADPPVEETSFQERVNTGPNALQPMGYTGHGEAPLNKGQRVADLVARLVTQVR